MERLRTLSEAECYERCYGWRHTEDSVKVLDRAPDCELSRRTWVSVSASMLELRLDAREVEAA